MKKIDLKKELKYLYAPSAKKVEVVDVPRFQFAMIDGRIKAGEEPATSQEFQEAMQALYGVSYGLKFISKLREENPIDYTVMSLEGLWWTEKGEFDFDKKEDWRWTVMMMQPDHITEEMYQKAVQQAREKKPSAAFSKIRFESFREGLSMQIMHIGPYSEEAVAIERMKFFAQETGYVLRGKHHEIYLGDPRRAKPEKLRTILRYPIEKSS